MLVARLLACGAVLATLAGIGCAPAPERFDVVVRGGLVLDGTGASGKVADVAIRDGLVVAIGEALGGRGNREIDASGLVVAPGFVDLHSHADLILLGDRATQERLLEAKLRQGVTTVVVGNCGLGAAPSDRTSAPILAAVNGWMTPEGIAAGPLDVGAYLDRLERGGVAVNVATLVPHGPVRITAMGLRPGAPTEAELASMRRAVARGLEQGAFGLSTGLIYPPGMYSATDELVALAGEVAAADGLFTSHVRGSSELLLPATDELIEIARRSGARAEHSHLEGVGRAYWGDVESVLAREDRAREDGLDLAHDVFPYTRAATMMSAIFPPWSLEGGIPGLLARLRDPGERDRIRRAIEGDAPTWPPWVEGGWPHNLVGAVGWDGIRIASVREDGPSGWVGRSLAEIAGEVGRDPFDVVADLMLDQDGQVGQFVEEISGSDEDSGALLAIVAHPAASIVSDAEDYGRGRPHPAHAGAFARALRLARERRLLPLEEVVRKMTSLPASRLGLRHRGTLAAGGPADLVVFDAGTVAERADREHPRAHAVGVRAVLVHGAVVVDGDRFLGGLHGTVLRRGPAGG